MNFSNVADILIAVAVVIFVIYRQFTWQLVNASRLWRMPIILAIVGVVMIAQIKSVGTSVKPVDLAILAAELVISLTLGAIMGTLARFRTRGQRESDVKNRSGQPTIFDPAITVVESRTGALGAGLWIVLIVVRVGIEIAATHYFPSVLLASTGTVLLAVAANRAARAFVIMTRMERRALVPSRIAS